MSPLAALVLFGAIAVGIAIAFRIDLRQKKSKELRTHFGSEYDRVMQQRGNRGRGEAELARRENRVKQFSIHPLPREESARFARMWNDQQARFVDEPKAAVVEADHIVTEVMKERGYPVGEFDQRAEDISVDHPRVVENYRAAHEITLREQRGQASTEDLREAMVYYRDLFWELLEDTRPMKATSR